MLQEDFEEHVREQVVDRFEKYHIYEGYKTLCDKYETIPITQEALMDKYVFILAHQPSYKERAEVHLITDKERLIESLEKSKSSIEDILDVNEGLLPFEHEILHSNKYGIICLVILFIDSNTIISPAYFNAGDGEVEFPEELFE